MPNPATNPYPRGAYIVMPFANQESNRFCVAFNWDVPFIEVLMANGVMSLNSVLIAGDIVVPREAADTKVEATISFAIDAPVDFNADIPTADDWGCHVLDAAGNQQLLFDLAEMPLDSTGGTGWTHNPNFEGDYDRHPLRIFDGLVADKGHVDMDVLAMQGPYDEQRGMTYPSAHGRALKVTRTIVVPWVTGAPYPFIGWPLNPQQRQIP